MSTWGLTIKCGQAASIQPVNGAVSVALATLLSDEPCNLKILHQPTKQIQSYMHLDPTAPNVVLGFTTDEVITVYLVGGIEDKTSVQIVGNCDSGVKPQITVALAKREPTDSNKRTHTKATGGFVELGMKMSITDPIGEQLKSETRIDKSKLTSEGCSNCCDCNGPKSPKQAKAKSTKAESTKADSTKAESKKAELSEASSTKHEKKIHSLKGGVKAEVVRAGNDSKVVSRGDTVKVQYEGRLAKDGKKFDRGVIEFVLGAGQMIPGFDIGVSGMKLNEQRKIFMPSAMAYGKPRVGSIPPNSDLIFTVTLMSVSGR